jgi:phosphoglycolate phosphatase-like HAD superfamily hydrolase
MRTEPARSRAARDGSPPMSRLWLFDFDNTLARLEPCVDWAASRRVLEPYLRSAGAPEPLFERIPRGNLPLYDAYRTHLLDGRARLSPPARATLARASAIIEEFELTGVDRAEPLDGALELLRALDSCAATVAIVTSNSSRTARTWFARHGAADAVDFIVGRDALLGLKPAPDSILRALKLASATARDAVLVGDSEADFRAARAAGVAFVAIAPSQAAHDRLLALGAGRIFSSPAALLISLNLPAAGSPRRGRSAGRG